MAKAPVVITPVPKEAATSKDSTSDINGKHLEIHMMLTRNSPSCEVEVKPAPVELRKCYHCGHFTSAITVCGVCGMR